MRRYDMTEAYTRVMGKAWAGCPDNGSRVLDKREVLKFLKASYKLWTGQALPPNYLKWEFTEWIGSPQRRPRTWRGKVALGSGWEALNHEWSHWVFYRHGPIRISGNGYNHHCDRHLEWERLGAELIRQRFINEIPATKLCRCCNTEKPLSTFGISRKAKDGRQCYCRNCARAYRRPMPVFSLAD